MVLPCDVEDIASRRRGVREIGERWGALDFRGACDRLLRQERAQGPLCRHHARELLAHDGDLLLLLHRDRQRAAALMPDGGAMVTLTYRRLDPRDAELQRHGRRQGGAGSLGALSRGRFRSARHPRQRDLGRAGAHARGRRHRRCAADVQFPEAPTRRCAARSRSRRSAAPALYLLSDLSTGVTGDIHFVDSGYNIISMPHPEALQDRRRRADRGRRAGRQGRRAVAAGGTVASSPGKPKQRQLPSPDTW